MFQTKNSTLTLVHAYTLTPTHARTHAKAHQRMYPHIHPRIPPLPRAVCRPTALYGVDPFLANHHSFTVGDRCNYLQVEYDQSNNQVH